MKIGISPPVPWNATPSAASHLPVPMTANRLYSGYTAGIPSRCQVPRLLFCALGILRQERSHHRHDGQMRDGREQANSDRKAKLLVIGNRIFTKKISRSLILNIHQKMVLQLQRQFFGCKKLIEVDIIWIIETKFTPELMISEI